MRASYLGLGVKGRPASLLCVGVCGRMRPSADFSYTARRRGYTAAGALDGAPLRNNSGGSRRATSAASRFEEKDAGAMCWGCSAASEARPSRPRRNKPQLHLHTRDPPLADVPPPEDNASSLVSGVSSCRAKGSPSGHGVLFSMDSYEY